MTKQKLGQSQLLTYPIQNVVGLKSLSDLTSEDRGPGILRHGRLLKPVKHLRFRSFSPLHIRSTSIQSIHCTQKTSEIPSREEHKNFTSKAHQRLHLLAGITPQAQQVNFVLYHSILMLALIATLSNQHKQASTRFTSLLDNISIVFFSFLYIIYFIYYILYESYKLILNVEIGRAHV